MIKYNAIGGYYNSPSFKEAVLTTAFILRVMLMEKLNAVCYKMYDVSFMGN